MGLIPKTEWIRNRLGAKIFLNDNTGEYNASTNPGGWGSPNAERANYALVPYVRYMKSTAGINGQECNYPTSGYDEGSSTEVEFEVDLVDDGWYYLAILFLPYTEATVGKVYWDTVTKSIKKVQEGDDIVISKQDVLDLDDEYKPMIVDCQEFLQPKLAIFRKQVTWDYTRSLVDNKTKDIQKQQETLFLLGVQMVDADYRYRSAEQDQAQLIVEDLINVRDNYGG